MHYFGVFITGPGPESVQYTLVASTAMLLGSFCPEACVTRHSPAEDAVI
jgi:hypothetical protein